MISRGASLPEPLYSLTRGGPCAPLRSRGARSSRALSTSDGPRRDRSAVGAPAGSYTGRLLCSICLEELNGMPVFPQDSRVFVAGHRGLVGSAVVRRLQELGYRNILTASREQLDLRDQAAVNYWFKANRPDHVFLVAGTVGGIMANATRPAEFLYDNLMIHGTVVHASHMFKAKR